MMLLGGARACSPPPPPPLEPASVYARASSEEKVQATRATGDEGWRERAPTAVTPASAAYHDAPAAAPIGPAGSPYSVPAEYCRFMWAA